jgi:hypothetical protein
VSDFPPSVLSLASVVTFGTMMRRKIATKRVTDPTLINGKVKPPRLYKAEPRAGPKHLLTYVILLILKLLV